MPANTTTYLPNMNAILKRAMELGIDCDHKVRVQVTQSVSPRTGITVTLLLDYHTINQGPGEAGFYAVGAKAMFDGLSLKQYEWICAGAKRRFSDMRSARHCAGLNLLLNGKAVIICEDAEVMRLIMSHLYEDRQNTNIFGLTGCQEMLDAQRYDGTSTLDGALGPITPDMVALDRAHTMAEGGVCVTEERLQEAKQAGMHCSRRAKMAS